ncbi:uncharacterized protein LOC107884321 [Acyrthosiphon pisum]|uniref:DNA endonuclease activator Ctp1 C-terminal domain-containing protein n=1 Tax=Acyrthosiphon pisum TaxID=7029 RepID=A0A8R2H8V8_ACYPI|nr:uncharacterized protein LOC107884321 [Acyrthosiphon pisum]|eukprot:XP_016661611.1 PREDICTED: uncharacterized protein LOC107884321 [Acyrthosiphon pisum]
MNNQNDGEDHVQMLTDVCQNVCTFIKTITMNNMSNVDKLNTFEIKINDLQCICSELKTKLEQIDEQRDGNPSDLLKKSKQTTLMLRPQKEKVKMDITTLSSPTPKISVLNSSSLFSPEILNLRNYTTNDNTICETNIIHNTELNDSTNISSKTIISHSQTEKHDHSNDETNCSPVNISMSVLNNATTLKKQIKIPNGNLLDSFDIIPGLNDKKNDLPNYKFKEDPVRKHNERKLLNGWDCKDCCKFYEENNDNPIDAKNAMNHFSRHRSHKHQHHPPTPPGFWDPM